VAEMSKPPQIQNIAFSLPSVFWGRINRGRNVDEAALLDIYYGTCWGFHATFLAIIFI
jgi:hypothetical protein